MKKVFLIFNIFLLISACNTVKNDFLHTVNTIKIDTLLIDKISSRALLIDEDYVWFGANQGNFGCISLKDKSIFRSKIVEKNIKLEFRSIAQTKEDIFLLSIANPALLYKVNKKTKIVEKVYEEHHEKVFYDAMLFINNKEGFAIGDPINEHPCIIKTENGGITWKKINEANLPYFRSGESFFAASNTNLNYQKRTLFMVSGGKSSNLYSSKDKGISWNKYSTPIIQGESMTGIFTSDFLNDKIGIIAGGNYEKLNDNTLNKAITFNGGKNWQLLTKKEAFGYTSCIQFIPNTNGKGLLATTEAGVFYSKNRGENWNKLLPDNDFVAFKFINSTTAIASGKNRIVRLNLIKQLAFKNESKTY
ncbi:WD40/YVTN/BNR-like repeat-containing protein [Flavobacterium oreochromis]|uniref:Oxidoreductase n=2 Tax=Flavobacterium TaxID=237 RepID=A0A246G824_9FLAO|nr:oxidoreductase [Flavobacterium oreochromis]OWP74167.1 oxidoreductase [Flavobacterium oreochromis]OWP74856.1 oxidoreductase [Flavobacterium oreochromis]